MSTQSCRSYKTQEVSGKHNLKELKIVLSPLDLRLKIYSPSSKRRIYVHKNADSSENTAETNELNLIAVKSVCFYTFWECLYNVHWLFKCFIKLKQPSTSKQIVQKKDQISKKSKKAATSRLQPSRKAKRSSILNSAENTTKKVNAKRAPNPRSSKLKLEERISRLSPKNEFVIGEIVLGTIPGYAPWPARIKNIIEDTVFIEFFGTGEM